MMYEISTKSEDKIKKNRHECVYACTLYSVHYMEYTIIIDKTLGATKKHNNNINNNDKKQKNWWQ